MQEYEPKSNQGQIVRSPVHNKETTASSGTRFQPIDEILSRLSEHQVELEAA